MARLLSNLGSKVFPVIQQRPLFSPPVPSTASPCHSWPSRPSDPPQSGGGRCLPSWRRGFPPPFRRLSDHRPTSRHLCHRTLPHRCPRRPDRAMRLLRPPPFLLSLLPQSPLPQVPSPCPRRLGPQASLRTARLPLLPPRLHPPPTHRRSRPPEPACRLHPTVPRCLPHPAHPRLRSQTPRRRDRLFRRPAYLGANPSAAPPPALRRPRRRHRSRR